MVLLLIILFLMPVFFSIIHSQKIINEKIYIMEFTLLIIRGSGYEY